MRGPDGWGGLPLRFQSKLIAFPRAVRVARSELTQKRVVGRKGSVKTETGTGLMDTRSKVSAFSFRPTFGKSANGPTGEWGSSDRPGLAENANNVAMARGWIAMSSAKSGSSR